MSDLNTNTQELGLDNIILDVDTDDVIGGLSEIIEEDNLETNTNDNAFEESEEETNETNENEVSDEDKDKDDKSKDGDQKDSKVEDAETKKRIGNSPLSSLANALLKDGVLTNLKDEDIAGIKSADDFASVLEKEIQSRLDDKIKRVDEALNLGVEPSEIKKNENVITYLNGITEETINEETEEATKLRMNLIVQDYMNKGFTQERAIKEANKSVTAGTDIEDALEALEANKTHFNKQYSNLINSAKKEQEEYKQTIIKRDKDVKENILKNETLFADLNINQDLRKKALDNIQKPVMTDKDGNKFSAIQKYEKENPVDFLSKVALLFTITDGFTNISKITKTTESQIKSKALKELEGSLNGNDYGLDGSLTFTNNLGGDDDENDKGYFVLDIKNN